jgi:PIN domain nuclease of toxin-antitoxin system
MTMRLLLDTHALLWWWTDDPQLSARARDAISDPANAVFVSAATAWELATKHRLGKLGEAAEAVGRFDELVVADGFQHVPINHYHCLKAGGYAVEHRDPFDRMLAAQTELEGLVLVTRDPALGLFGVATFW